MNSNEDYPKRQKSLLRFISFDLDGVDFSDAEMEQVKESGDLGLL